MQWNHHWLDYLRSTGLFCLVSKLFVFLQLLLRIGTHILIHTLLNIGTLVLTQWNHHRLDYLRSTGLFCLVSKQCFPPHTVENTNTYLNPHTDKYRNTSFDTVEPSLARLPQVHRIILPCVKTLFSPNTVENTNTYLHPHTVEYRNTCFDTVEPSSARLPQVHMIILPCVKRVLSSTHC